MIPPDPPPGFRRLNLETGFIGHNGPIYLRMIDRDLTFGFRILPHHCNPMDICHGGWVATMMDMVLPLTARLLGDDLENRFLLTVSMTVDYLGSARLGDWVEGRAEILRQTGRMVFIEGRLVVGTEICARGSGVFRRGPEAPTLEFQGIC